MEMECFYLLDLVPHVRRRELAGAGRSHREGRADADTDVVRLLGCDRERHRRVPARRPALASVSSQHRHLQKEAQEGDKKGPWMIKHTCDGGERH